jgi:hypothetical protein
MQYSDSLMVTLLKGNDPEKFAERTKTDFRATAEYDSFPFSTVSVLDVMTPQELADFKRRMLEEEARKASVKVIEAGGEPGKEPPADE